MLRYGYSNKKLPGSKWDVDKCYSVGLKGTIDSKKAYNPFSS